MSEDKAMVWDQVVGQPTVVAELRQAVAATDGSDPAHAMTHAWLITGPPGSGRTTAALAFAASLLCDRQGCGSCNQCMAVLGGDHPDVEMVRSTTLSLGKDTTKQLVAQAAGAPVAGKWRIFVLEDSDRMTEAAANTLLKSIEEPTGQTVWILSAPSPEDLLPTIRSRTRHVALRVPAADAVAQLLISEGIDPGMAAFAAHAAQGHIGRARALAQYEEVRNRRAEVLRLPRELSAITDAYESAADLKRNAEAAAKQRSQELDDKENAELLEVYGAGADGVNATKVRSLAKRALSDLSKKQAQRSSRSVRDELDRNFLDLLGFYRDVLMVQSEVPSEPVNLDLVASVEQFAQLGDLNETMMRIEALTLARAQLASNVPPQLVCEALMVQLLHPVRPKVGR